MSRREAGHIEPGCGRDLVGAGFLEHRGDRREPALVLGDPAREVVVGSAIERCGDGVLGVGELGVDDGSGQGLPGIRLGGLGGRQGVERREPGPGGAIPCGTACQQAVVVTVQLGLESDRLGGQGRERRLDGTGLGGDLGRYDVEAADCSGQLGVEGAPFDIAQVLGGGSVVGSLLRRSLRRLVGSTGGRGRLVRVLAGAADGTGSADGQHARHLGSHAVQPGLADVERVGAGLEGRLPGDVVGRAGCGDLVGEGGDQGARRPAGHAAPRRRAARVEPAALPLRCGRP